MNFSSPSSDNCGKTTKFTFIRRLRQFSVARASVYEGRNVCPCACVCGACLLSPADLRVKSQYSCTCDNSNGKQCSRQLYAVRSPSNVSSLNQIKALSQIPFIHEPNIFALSTFEVLVRGKGVAEEGGGTYLGGGDGVGDIWPAMPAPHNHRVLCPKGSSHNEVPKSNTLSMSTISRASRRQKGYKPRTSCVRVYSYVPCQRPICPSETRDGRHQHRWSFSGAQPPASDPQSSSRSPDCRSG